MKTWTLRFSVLAVNAGFWIGVLVYSLIRIDHDAKQSNLPWLLFATGALGAVLANYQKLAEIPRLQEEIDSTLRRTAVLHLCVSPFVGGVYAILLWMLFFSGLLQGDLFPFIDKTTDPYDNWHNLMNLTHPRTNRDAAKGIVWSFVAGYADRFVPSVLDRLAQRAKEEKENRDEDD